MTEQMLGAGSKGKVLYALIFLYSITFCHSKKSASESQPVHRDSQGLSLQWLYHIR